MWKTVLELVPGRMTLRMLLLRLDPDERLCGKPLRVGRLDKLSKRSSSWEFLTSQTVDWDDLGLRAATGGRAGSESSMATSSSSTSSAVGIGLATSSSDHTEDTLDKCGFQRPDAGPGVKSRSEEADVSARELEDGARIRGN
jgi:hypothetical protein